MRLSFLSDPSVSLRPLLDYLGTVMGHIYASFLSIIAGYTARCSRV